MTNSFYRSAIFSILSIYEGSPWEVGELSKDSDGLYSKLISSFQNTDGRCDSILIYYFLGCHLIL